MIPSCRACIPFILNGVLRCCEPIWIIRLVSRATSTIFDMPAESSFGHADSNEESPIRRSSSSRRVM